MKNLILAAVEGDLTTGLKSIGFGIMTGNAVQAMARQPEMAGQVRTTMFLGIAFAEALALFGFALYFI